METPQVASVIRSGTMAPIRASSRNALKHGLAADKWAQTDWRRISMLEEALKAGNQASRIGQAAKRAAKARDFLERVQAAREEAFVKFLAAARVEQTESGLLDNPLQLEASGRRLDSLVRYERQATVRWERAIDELEAAELEEANPISFKL